MRAIALPQPYPVTTARCADSGLFFRSGINMFVIPALSYGVKERHVSVRRGLS